MQISFHIRLTKSLSRHKVIKVCPKWSCRHLISQLITRESLLGETSLKSKISPLAPPKSGQKVTGVGTVGVENELRNKLDLLIEICI